MLTITAHVMDRYNCSINCSLGTRAALKLTISNFTFYNVSNNPRIHRYVYMNR